MKRGEAKINPEFQNLLKKAGWSDKSIYFDVRLENLINETSGSRDYPNANKYLELMERLSKYEDLLSKIKDKIHDYELGTSFNEEIAQYEKKINQCKDLLAQYNEVYKYRTPREGKSVIVKLNELITDNKRLKDDYFKGKNKDIAVLKTLIREVGDAYFNYLRDFYIQSDRFANDNQGATTAAFREFDSVFAGIYDPQSQTVLIDNKGKGSTLRNNLIRDVNRVLQTVPTRGVEYGAFDFFSAKSEQSRANSLLKEVYSKNDEVQDLIDVDVTNNSAKHKRNNKFERDTVEANKKCIKSLKENAMKYNVLHTGLVNAVNSRAKAEREIESWNSLETLVSSVDAAMNDTISEEDAFQERETTMVEHQEIKENLRSLNVFVINNLDNFGKQVYFWGGSVEYEEKSYTVPDGVKKLFNILQEYSEIESPTYAQSQKAISKITVEMKTKSANGHNSFFKTFAKRSKTMREFYKKLGNTMSANKGGNMNAENKSLIDLLQKFDVSLKSEKPDFTYTYKS